MEACAFLKICDHNDLQSLGIVKGVSDLGDGNKTTMKTRAQVYQKALENTGEAVLEWIRHMFESMTWEPNEGKRHFDDMVLAALTAPDDEAGAILCGPYYNNFIRLLGDSVARGDPVTSIDQPNQQLQPPVGLTVVMPPDIDPSHYEEQGHIERIARDHGVMQVLTGGVSNHYKSLRESRTANRRHLSLEHLQTHRVLQKETHHRFSTDLE
jgi:hypothetical protein